MKILPVHQGTPEWHQAKAKHPRSASKASAMMGDSQQIMRNDLLRMEATLSEQEFSEWAQKNLIDKGHEAEATMRPIVEKYLKGALLPLTCTTDDGYLLASFDGINEELRAGWEHKLWNEKLAAQIRAKQLEPHYYWQLEHQAVVGNLDYVIFTCSDGTKERAVHMKYVPVPGRREALLAGWKQFDEDLVNYQPVEVLPPVTAASVMALPAVSVQVNGSLTILDNFAVFEVALRDFIDHRLIREPETDQDFADLDLQIKALKNAESALDAAEAQMLAQVDSVDMAKRTKDMLHKLTRDNRLMAEKLLNAKKDDIRIKIVTAGRAALNDHLAMLNKRLGRPYMPLIAENLGGAIKGKKTVASLRDAVDSEVARVKIELNAVADKIQINLTSLIDLASEHKFLFADTAQLVLKDNDDLVNLIKLRISEHKTAEAKRLEAERDRIRQEETVKAETEARAKVEAEQRTQREQAEAKARQEREEQDIKDRRIAQALADEDARLQAERDRKAAAQRAETDRLDGIARAQEARRQELLDTDQLITTLYERIKTDAKYAKITKAIEAYFAKAQKKAA